MRSTSHFSALAVLCFVAAALLISAPIKAAQPDRPLIFLPGILGSKLVDENGDILWGNRKSYFNFRHITLPADEDQIKLRPDGVIDSITIVWPFKVKQYRGLRKTLSELGYVEDQNLFIFAYDWRRSNYKNAELLEQFIEETPALQDGQFDLIAHSMGGIVSLILIHEHDAGNRVRNYITLGTPYFGSLNALEIFLDGFSGVGNFMSTIGTSKDDIRSVMFSFESGYELLPSYDLCCILGGLGDQNATPMDLYSTDQWTSNWLPSGFSSAENKAFIADGLVRGKELRDLIKQPLPTDVNHYMFAGDKFDTRAQVYFEQNGDIDDFKKLGGDGTVWLQSATRLNQQAARVSFKKHATIFDDKALKTELGWILTPDGPLTDFAATFDDVKFESTAGNSYEANLVFFETTPVIVALGKPVKARMEISGPEIIGTSEVFEFTVCVDIPTANTAETCKPFEEVSPSELSRNFEADFDLPSEGDFTVRLVGKDGVEDYFSVIDTN